MKNFAGFSSRTGFTPIPNDFLSQLLPQIDDLAELKVTLHLFWALYRRRGYPRYISYSELTGDRGLMALVGGREEALYRSLEQALGRGTILRLAVEREGRREPVYFLNTEVDRRALARIESGELPLPGAVPLRERPSAEGPAEQPNIFTLYEENIGLLNPMIADQLKEAEGLYPASWIEEAFREAVSLNKRSWRYISRILERWASEGKEQGKEHGKAGRYPEAGSEKYFKGKYGHLVQH